MRLKEILKFWVHQNISWHITRHVHSKQIIFWPNFLVNCKLKTVNIRFVINGDWLLLNSFIPLFHCITEFQWLIRLDIILLILVSLVHIYIWINQNNMSCSCHPCILCFMWNTWYDNSYHILFRTTPIEVLLLLYSRLEQSYLQCEIWVTDNSFLKFQFDPSHEQW